MSNRALLDIMPTHPNWIIRLNDQKYSHQRYNNADNDDDDA